MATSSYDRWAFDLDGTLVDVEPAYVHDLLERIGGRLGYRFTEQEAEALWHGFAGERNATLEAAGLDPERFWDVFHDEEDAEARAAATFLYDDAELVGEIDTPTVLVTHCQEYLTEPVLSALDIADWFDTVVCCTSETGWKPDPAPVERALSAAGARDGPGILVGDGAHDIGAAWNAGLDGAHIERHGHDRRGLCVVGDYRLDRLDELARLT